MPVRRFLDIEISAMCRGRGKPLKNQIKIMKKDILDLEMIEGLWTERIAWRAKIHIVNPDNIRNELW